MYFIEDTSADLIRTSELLSCKYYIYYFIQYSYYIITIIDFYGGVVYNVLNTK